jgi:hypothetical protein
MRIGSAPRFLAAAGLIVLAFAASGCGGGSPKSPITNSGSNVQAIVVNSGPNGNYANGVFTSVTVCVPSSSNCQSIDGILVDTGSYGLRLLSSTGGGALNLNLPAQNGANGNPVGVCGAFVDGYTWGRVMTADVKISGEKASNLPVQVIDSTFAAVPTTCKNFGGPEEDTIQSLGANGILGVGPFLQDCGTACTQTGSSNPGLYYDCAATSCQVATEALAQQLQNPVSLFAVDNNGVVIELPAVSSSTASVNGSLVFGIGTESNNGLGNAKIFPLDTNAEFNTNYKGQTYPAFIDSGSNALFFLNTTQTSFPACSDNSGFYCPNSAANQSAITSSNGGASATVNFAVGNADTLFSNQGAFVFPTLAGPNPGTFDWGLPFFFGRKVFNAIESQNTPGGTGPYWAF